MNAYTVRARRWERGWELHIDGVGVTQSHGLADAEDMARSYIAMMTDLPADQISVDIVPEIGGGLDEDTANARRAVRQAEEAQRDAATRSRAVAHKLRDKGLTGRDIAVVLRVSPQRVSQLLKTSDSARTAAG